MKYLEVLLSKSKSSNTNIVSKEYLRLSLSVAGAIPEQQYDEGEWVVENAELKDLPSILVSAKSTNLR